MQNLIIRPMQPRDVQAVTEIEKLVQMHPWTMSQFLESVESYHSMVVEQQRRIIGFCILQPVLDEANLLLMAIHPNYQGRGIGYQLLEQSLQSLTNNPIQVFLEVRESNLTAIKLYEKIGFHQIDLRRNYYPNLDNSHEHAIIMVKSCTDDFAALFK